MSVAAAREFDARGCLQRLFAHCESVRASDIHLSAALAPRFRIQGRLASDKAHAALAAEEIEACGLELIVETMPPHQASLEGARQLLWNRGAVDGATTSADGHRYRFNVYRENGVTAVALRRLDDQFQTLEELGLPSQLARFSQQRDGLVVVTGPTGSGKSTTLATLIDQINRTRDAHIITIEDPVEYLHYSQKSLVRQRQIGRDARDFNSALVESLRQDPDVILVGEIRELETIRTAITAAETGHLVFTTLHAGDCVGAIERLVAVFPTGEQEGIRRQLALVLRGIFAQHLLPPLRAGERRVASSELLLVNVAIANLIATAKSAQIYSAIETGTGLGMQTLDQSLTQLVSLGKIAEETALAMSRNPTLLKERLRNGNGRGFG